MHVHDGAISECDGLDSSGVSAVITAYPQVISLVTLLCSNALNNNLGTM